MADFVAVLTKTIDGLGESNTPAIRQKVYEKARKTIADKLAAIVPAPSPELAGRQYRMLDEAIQKVEDIYAPEPVAASVAPPVLPRVVVAPVPVVTPAPYRDPLEDFMASVESDLAKKPTLPKPVAPASVDIFRSTSDVDALLADQIKSNAPDPVVDVSSRDPWLTPAVEPAPSRKKSGAGLGVLYGLLGLLLVGGAGYAGYINKDKLQDMLGMNPAAVPASTTPVTMKPATPAAPVKPAAVTPPAAETVKPATPAATPAVDPAKPAAPDAAATPAAEVPKFTQRLTADGQEIEAGPGPAPQDVGEGSTVAAATTPASAAPATVPATDLPAVTPVVDGTTPAVAPADGTTPAAAAPAATPGVIPVGQKAIFYEEKTGTEAGTADQGAVVWSEVQDSPGLDQPPEAAIRGEITIPDKGMKVKLTIKRNVDKSLPASHIIEMLFTTPPEFAGGAIENVQRVALKDTEQAPGSPLIGVPASFGDGFFLVALTDEKTAIDTNLTLLKRQDWIDVPVSYRSGRRALLSFEKGLAGDKVFQDVFKAWETK